LEHRLTLTPGGSLAGAWWDRDNPVRLVSGSTTVPADCYSSSVAGPRASNDFPDGEERTTESLIDDLAGAVRLIADRAVGAAARDAREALRTAALGSLTRSRMTGDTSSGPLP
jgi:hypothetical protein